MNLIKNITPALLILMLCFMSYGNAFAQFTGGGQEDQEEEEEAPVRSSVSSSSIIGNAFMIKAGWASPSGTYGTAPEPNDSFTGMMSSETGFGAESGFTLGLYGASPLGYAAQNINNSGVSLELGFQWGIAYSQTTPNWGNASTVYQDDTSYTPFHLFDLKVGPMLAISPTNDLVFDLYYNPMLSLGIPPEIDTETGTGSNMVTQSFFSEEEFAYGLRHGIGFNVRYSIFMFSIETTFGTMNMDYTQSLSSPGNSFTNEYEAELSTSFTKITLGLFIR